MENVSRPEYGGNSTKSLRNISNAIVHIQIRRFSIDPTWRYKFSKFFNKVFQCVWFLCMFRYVFIDIILIVADYVRHEIDNFLVFFCYFLQKWQKVIIQVIFKIVVHLLTHLAESFVELFCWILVLLNVHMAMEKFD